MSQWNMALHPVVAIGLGSDRGPAVHEPAHRRIPLAQGLHQARHQLPQSAPPCPGQSRKQGTVADLLASVPACGTMPGSQACSDRRPGSGGSLSTITALPCPQVR